MPAFVLLEHLVAMVGLAGEIGRQAGAAIAELARGSDGDAVMPEPRVSYLAVTRREYRVKRFGTERVLVPSMLGVQTEKAGETPT